MVRGCEGLTNAVEERECLCLGQRGCEMDSADEEVRYMHFPSTRDGGRDSVIVNEI